MGGSQSRKIHHDGPKPICDEFAEKLGREVWQDLHTIGFFAEEYIAGPILDILKCNYPCSECRLNLIAKPTPKCRERCNATFFWKLHNIVNKCIGKKEQPKSILEQYGEQDRERWELIKAGLPSSYELRLCALESELNHLRTPLKLPI